MEKVCRFIQGNKIYQDVFLKTWRIYINKIINEHSLYGYELMFSKFDYSNYLEFVDKVQYEKELTFFSKAKYETELDARTEVFRLVSECEKIVKELFSLAVIYTYQNNNDSEMVCGIIDSNLQFVKILELKIIKENEYIIDVTYYSDIIFVMSSYFDKYHLISSLIPKQKYGGIVLGKRCPQVKQVIQELNNNYNILWGDNNLPMKQQYEILHNKDVSYIFEIKNHGKLTLRDLSNNEVYAIDYNELNEILNNIELANNQLLYKQSLKNKVDFERNQSRYFCEECYQKIEDFDAFIKPFNQRANVKKCGLCASKAYIKLIEIK